MKSERRHHLERNELADRIGSGLNSVQSIMPMILGGLVILVIGSIAWGLYSGSVKKKEAEAWTEYYFNLTGGDGESFLDVADEFPTSSAAGWAQQTAGDSYLEKGIEALYRNRSEGERLITQAIEAFEEVEQTTQNEQLRAKALLGLAQGHESLGELEEAKSYYQQFVATTSPPRMLSAANERLAFINSETGKQFYSWFDNLDPKPDAPIQLPNNLSLPPAQPNLQFEPPTSGSDSAANPSAPSASTAAPGQAEINPADLPAIPKMEIQPQGDATSTDELKLPAAGGPVSPPDAGAQDTPVESTTDTPASDDS